MKNPNKSWDGVGVLSGLGLVTSVFLKSWWQSCLSFNDFTHSGLLSGVFLKISNRLRFSFHIPVEMLSNDNNILISCHFSYHSASLVFCDCKSSLSFLSIIPYLKMFFLPPHVQFSSRFIELFSHFPTIHHIMTRSLRQAVSQGIMKIKSPVSRINRKVN